MNNPNVSTNSNNHSCVHLTFACNRQREVLPRSLYSHSLPYNPWKHLLCDSDDCLLFHCRDYQSNFLWRKMVITSFNLHCNRQILTRHLQSRNNESRRETVVRILIPSFTHDLVYVPTLFTFLWWHQTRAICKELDRIRDVDVKSVTKDFP